jgi:subfamily B ATP-binding cassette protein MsbA
MIDFLRRIWVFVRPYQTRLFLGLICGILFAAANGALVMVIKSVVNHVFGTNAATLASQQSHSTPEVFRPLVQKVTSWLPQVKTKSGLILIILSLPLVMFIRGVFSYLNIYLMSWAAMRAVADLRTKLFDHLQNLSMDFFSSASTGDLISRITNDTQVLNNVIGNSIATIIKDPITILFLLIWLLSQEPGLTFLSIVVLPTCFVPIIAYGRKMRKSARAMQTHAAELSNLMHESFTGTRIIKAFNLEDVVLGQFKEGTQKYVNHMMRVVRANEIPSQLTEFLGALGVALVFLFVVLVPNQTKLMNAGDFIAFIMSIFLMYQPIKSLTQLRNRLEQARAASERVFELLDTGNSIVDPASPVPLHAANATIQFENIDFDYGDKPILRGISLTVKPGQLVALVGGSGSGKTTLANLLLRFYDPKSGSVKIGSVDLRQAAIKDLRRQIALVAQDTILFNDTVRGNIAIGARDATPTQIEAAAKYAYAHEFISEKEQGYDTIVGEKGIALSGGQRQRIAIARAILKNAPILILDEATNALDAESERVVQADLERLMVGRTTICIAHRLSTIQKADLIVVLDQGRIVETGTHAELMTRRGAYCKLYELQASV